MQFSDFLNFSSQEVAHLVRAHASAPIAVAIPFNGTRRWYMAAHNKDAEAVFSEHYLETVLMRMLDIIGLMFADGVRTVYTPVMGRALMDRGEAYMQFGIQAIGNLAGDAALNWYTEHQVAASAYGQLDLLPPAIREKMDFMAQVVTEPKAYLRYGIFADQPLDDLLKRTIQMYEQTGQVPTSQDFLSAYYGGQPDPVTMWIGSDQPTVFDVPLVLHEQTALYFLQYPTLYMDYAAWRRLLYDCLFVRGDDETLYPDNIMDTRQVMGLGVRTRGGWQPGDY